MNVLSLLKNKEALELIRKTPQQNIPGSSVIFFARAFITNIINTPVFTEIIRVR